LSNLIRHLTNKHNRQTTNNKQQETTPRLNSLLKDTMDAAMDAIHAQLAQLRSSLDDIPTLQKLEDQTNVPKEYLSVGAGATLLVIIFFGLNAGTLCSITGFCYPAFKSFQALEHRASGDVTQWLIYWVVYSFFSIIEVFVDFLLYWIPFYYAFKIAFLLWAMMPQTRGAKFIYDSFLKDFLKSNETKIDAALKNAKSAAGKVGEEAKTATKDAVSAVAENMKKSGDDKKVE